MRQVINKGERFEVVDEGNREVTDGGKEEEGTREHLRMRARERERLSEQSGKDF